MDDIILTPSEKEGKEYVLRLLREAVHKPCDNGDVSNLNSTMPEWFNSEKFKRGQKYFLDNRFGILTSNLHGLLLIFAEPHGLNILSSTGKSSNTETARKRYISTILHTLAWYEVDFTPGSTSWKSIVRTRKLHLNASNYSQNIGIGCITQMELAITTFGFMGLALIRPHHLGIRYNNKEDREAFVHVWAVLGYMIGLEDQFNMCLNRFETVEMICLILLRFMFMPIFQLETPQFKLMLKAFCTGLSPYLPRMVDKLLMFEVKKMIGIPGYQYRTDLSKEIICRQIFTNDELHEIQQIVQNLNAFKHIKIEIPKDIPLIEIYNIVDDYNNNNNNNNNNNYNKESMTNENFQLYKYLGLNTPNQINIKMINDKDWRKSLNDSKYYELNKKFQNILRRKSYMYKFYEYRLGKYILEVLLDVLLYRMKNYLYQPNKIVID